MNIAEKALIFLIFAAIDIYNLVSSIIEWYEYRKLGYREDRKIAKNVFKTRTHLKCADGEHVLEDKEYIALIPTKKPEEGVVGVKCKLIRGECTLCVHNEKFGEPFDKEDVNEIEISSDDYDKFVARHQILFLKEGDGIVVDNTIEVEEEDD